jgi:hypothetical protein
VHDRVGLMYGHGLPHCRPHQVHEASVSSIPHEWWTPVHFPRADYLFKGDTGARVNVMSIADLSRLGFDFCDLTPSSILLMGFNRSIEQPCGQLETLIRVNGAGVLSDHVPRCGSLQFPTFVFA